MIHRDLLMMYSEPCRALFKYGDSGKHDRMIVPVSHATLKMISELFHNMPLDFASTEDLIDLVKAFSYLMLPHHLAGRLVEAAFKEMTPADTEDLPQQLVNNYAMLSEAFRSNQLDWPQDVSVSLTGRCYRYIYSLLKKGVSSPTSLIIPRDIWQEALNEVMDRELLSEWPISGIYLKLLPIIPEDILELFANTVIKMTNSSYDFWRHELSLIMKHLLINNLGTYQKVSQSFADRLSQWTGFESKWRPLRIDQTVNIIADRVYKLTVTVVPTGLLWFEVDVHRNQPHVAVQAILVGMPYVRVLKTTYFQQSLESPNLYQHSCPKPDSWKPNDMNILYVRVDV